MPKIYIVNFAGHDYSEAKKFGDEFINITSGYISHQSLDRLAYVISEAIKDSTVDDYLLLSGTAVINAIAVLCWYFKHNQVSMLVHDFKKQDGNYRVVSLSLEQLYEINRNVEE